MKNGNISVEYFFNYSVDWLLVIVTAVFKRLPSGQRCRRFL
jgi:hypothetical protein